MADKPIKLTVVQARVVRLLAEGQRLYWSVSFNSYFIGLPGVEHNSRRVQQITVFEIKCAGLIDGLMRLNETGVAYAKSKGWCE